ncbi:Sys1p [Rhodotorula paludigena]|uniref:Sys1p n=1 Tax=Rhodotorula paludigena TaxID=86838 RepID=UPI0031818588
MPPAARLNFPSSVGRSPSISVTTNAAPQRFRVQGWDPVLIISQIVSLQALHYLALSLVLPALLSILSNRDKLLYEGGATSISMAMNWKSFTGGTASGLPASRALHPGLAGLAAVQGGLGDFGKVDAADLARGVVRVIESDAFRGWAVALGWIMASMADIFFLYHVVRRPTHILDFSLTLIFNHLILTTYYSHSFPSSLFFWLVVGGSAVAQIVLAEQLCVRREMRDGFSVAEMTPRIGTSEMMSPHMPDVELGQVGGGKNGYDRLPADERV